MAGPPELDTPVTPGQPGSLPADADRLGPGAAPAGDGFGARLCRALTQPWLLWTLAGIFWARVVLLDLANTERPDGRSFVAAGGALIRHPAGVYGATADTLARTGYLPVHGLLGPPFGALLAAPFGVMPQPLGLALWSLGDAVAMLAGLAIVYRLAAPSGWRRPLFWLVAAYFPAVAADLAAGQFGGYILLPAAAALALGRRPGVAGALAGVAAAIKLYPAAMLLGAGPRRFVAFTAGLLVAAAGATLAALVPLGGPATRQYLTAVLVPVLSGKIPDCEINSVRTLYMRGIGGEPYPLIGGDGRLLMVHSPLHLPALALGLYGLTVGGLVLAAILAARRSGWHPAYGPALGLALGALIPGEVNVYQQLPLLPLVLLTLVRAVEARRIGPSLLIGAGLLAVVRQPCAIPIPDLWTLAALALYAAGVWQAGLFKEVEAWRSTGK